MSLDSTPISGRLSSALGWSMGIAILLVVLGLFAVILPVISGIAITLFVGWVLALFGVLHFALAWKSHATSTVLWELFLGFAYVVAGVYLIVHPLAGLATLTLFLAGYLLVKGILVIIQYFQIQPRHGSPWLLVDGIVNLFLAIIIWRSWPTGSVWVVGTLIGISLLFTGVSRLMLTMSARRALLST